MSFPSYVELPTIAPVLSARDLDQTGYLAANPDVRAAGLTAADHFARYGVRENRQQFVNATAIEKLRRRKLAALSFRYEITANDGTLNFLPQDVRDSMEIPEFPPIAANNYNAELIDIIRANPKSIFLDVGAGLRHTYYSNVVNAEIWRSASTDVVCIGEDLPFTDKQFDHVFCLAVLEHTKRPWLAAQEIIRVTKPGGVIRIDWPFLQPVHGYPHHFFNATSKGSRSVFEEQCDIVSCEVRPWQHPIFALSWMVNEWRNGLPVAERTAFCEMKIGDLLEHAPQQLSRPFCSSLSAAAQETIAAGTTLIARKR